MLLTEQLLGHVVRTAHPRHLRKMTGHGHHLCMVVLELLPSFAQCQYGQDRRDQICGEDQDTHAKRRQSHDFCIYQDGLLPSSDSSVSLIGTRPRMSAASMPRFQILRRTVAEFTGIHRNCAEPARKRGTATR